jgi:hypothetical protein
VPPEVKESPALVWLFPRVSKVKEKRGAGGKRSPRRKARAEPVRREQTKFTIRKKAWAYQGAPKFTTGSDGRTIIADKRSSDGETIKDKKGRTIKDKWTPQDLKLIRQLERDRAVDHKQQNRQLNELHHDIYEEREADRRRRLEDPTTSKETLAELEDEAREFQQRLTAGADQEKKQRKGAADKKKRDDARRQEILTCASQVAKKAPSNRSNTLRALLAYVRQTVAEKYKLTPRQVRNIVTVNDIE